MTLKEKNEKQRKTFKEIYESVKVRPSDPNFINGFLYDKIEEILNRELEFYSLTNRDENEKLKLYFSHGGADANWCGTYKEHVLFSITNYARVVNPELVLNIDVETYDDIVGPNKKWRLSAAREILADFYHEFRHYRQSLMAQAPYSSLITLRIAREKALLVTNKRLYDNNHDNYYIEADAEMEAYKNVNSIRRISHKDVIYKKRRELNRNISFLLTADKGFVERDSYMAEEIQRGLAKIKYGGLLKFYPSLGKEYNMDCRPKRLYELIKNYESEILDFAEKIEDPRIKRVITLDIKDMYFELFGRRIMKGSYFELAEAIRMCGYYEVKQILSELRLYNRDEKNRKHGFIKETLDFETKVFNESIKSDEDEYAVDIEGYLRKNKGVIHGLSKGITPIKTNKYIEKLDFDRSNPAIPAFLSTDWFLEHIPACGYYVFKNGQKVSIADFIKNHLVPMLNDPEISPSDYKYFFITYALDSLKPSFEVEAMFLYEETNRQYQLLENKIDACFNSIFIKDRDFNDQINDNYILDTIDTMALIERVCNEEDSLFAYFQITHYEPDISYFESELDPDEVEEKLNKLLKLAKEMNAYKEFNPKGINYLLKFKQKQMKLIKMIREKAREWEEAEPLELTRGDRK